MRNRHPHNERIKRRYFAYLEEAKRMSTESVDQIAAAIAMFEASNSYRDFGKFHIEQARRFKRQLVVQINPVTGKPLAKATIHSRLMALRGFFFWLAGQPGYNAQRLFGSEDPLFPATKMALDRNGLFAAGGLDRRHWKDAGAVRRIFQQAFEGAGLPYFNPHSFRKTLAMLGQKLCRSPEELKAWSQNLGHDHVLTTFTSYGAVSHDRQREIMNSLTTTSTTKSTVAVDADKMQRLFERLGID